MESTPLYRNSILLAGAAETLPHLGRRQLTLFLLPDVFLLHLLTFADLFLEGGNLIADISHQKAGQFHCRT